MKKLLLAALFLLGCIAARAQTCPTYVAPSGGSFVAVQDLLWSTDGAPANGVITLSWATFKSSDGHTNQAACLQYPVVDGSINISLEPNAGSSPSNTFYIAQYAINGGPTRYQEIWVIPASGPVNLAAIRTTPTPTVTYLISCSQLPALSGDTTSPGGSCVTTAGNLVVKTNQANIYSSGLQDLSASQFKPPLSTVASLPTASSNTNRVYEVTDGSSSSDCTSGSGTSRVWCVSNGSTWAAMGGSGGGGGGATASNQLVDCLYTRTSATVLTMATGCNASNNGVTTVIPGSQTLTVSGSTGLTVRIYVSDGSDGQSAGTLVVANTAAAGVVAAGGAVVVNNISAFPAGQGGLIPLGSWTATGTPGNWDVSGYTDFRSVYGGGYNLKSGNGNCAWAFAGSGATLTCSGGGSVTAGTYYTTPGYQTGNIPITAANATFCSAHVIPTGGLSVGHVVVNVSTADGSNNSDVGVYSAAGALEAHIGAQHLGSTGVQTIAFTGGTQTIAAGKAYFCATSASNTITFEAVYNGAIIFNNTVSGATTSGGALLSSFTAPADAPSLNGNSFSFLLVP